LHHLKALGLLTLLLWYGLVNVCWHDNVIA
jgi:hypothetical protein